MSQSLLYQWETEIASHFPFLNTWQQANTALFSYGIIEAKDCQHRAVSQALYEYGTPESLERRFQRFLANDDLNPLELSKGLIAWVRQAWESETEWTLLVDETKLGPHLGCLVVGVAYEKRCLPLIWHVYKPCAYPRAGQVGLIVNLLMHIKHILPADACPLMMADRGIGCSPKLIRAVEAMGWRYLFRLTKQTKIVTEEGDYTLYEQAKEGETWWREGTVFKRRGRIPAYAIVRWDLGYDDPWVLVTNDETLQGTEYAQRAWQECSFRDLKSGGWQWGHSHVWNPRHASILLFLMSLAYTWMVTFGVYAFSWGRAAKPRKFKSGRRVRQYSLFQEGINLWVWLKRKKRVLCLKFCFIVWDKPPD